MKSANLWVSACLLASFAIPAAAAPLTGAIFTTDRNGEFVNGNIYDHCCDVFLNGGPPRRAPCTSAGLPDGDYYFQVTNPSGALLLSADAVSERSFTVVSGVIVAYTGAPTGTQIPCIHELGLGKCSSTVGGISIQLMPFNETDNPGGEYKVWVTRISDYDPTNPQGNFGFIESASKTDNFKCKHDNATPDELMISCALDFEICADQGVCEALVTYTAPFVHGGIEPYVVDCLPASGSLFPVGVTTVTCTVTDSAAPAVQAVCSFDVTVVDCEAPTIDCPMNPIVCSDAGVCSAQVNFTVTADDNCTISAPVIDCDHDSGDIFPVGTTQVTCTATDAAGNSAQCSFDVIVNDCGDPSLDCPLDIDVCNDSGECSAIVNFSVSAEDDCDGALAAVCTPAAGSVFPRGTTVVNCSATDAAGNTGECSFEVTVNDCEDPVLDCQNIDTCNDAGSCGAIVTFAISGDDNCDGAIAAQCDATSGALFAVGTTTVNCTATDSASNTGNCSFDIIVRDCFAPVLDCQDLVVCNDAGACGATVNFAVVGQDECDGSVAAICDATSGSFFPVGTLVINCTATDAAGNTSNCSFELTVNDCSAPTIPCVDIVICNDAGVCGASVQFSLLGEDECAGGVMVVCDRASGEFFPVGSTQVNCTATDGAGNVGLCSFNVTINDCEAPIPVCPPDIVTCNDAGSTGATVNYMATATDNCDPSPVIVCDLPSGSLFPAGTTLVTCTATDAAGNSAQCSFDVTVNACCNILLVIDEDSIDNGLAPNFFNAAQVNDDIAEIGVRNPLRYFQANVGSVITLHTGSVGDEGWFAPTQIPASWDAAGPTPFGATNFKLAGPGLGTPDSGGDREALLDQIPGVIPLRADGLAALVGETICAVVYDSDISINYGPIKGNLKGANLGVVAFEVIAVRQLFGHSSGSLPEVDILIKDASTACACSGAMRLFTDAPVPFSSSEPYDVDPTTPSVYR